MIPLCLSSNLPFLRTFYKELTFYKTPRPPFQRGEEDGDTPFSKGVKKMEVLSLQRCKEDGGIPFARGQMRRCFSFKN